MNINIEQIIEVYNFLSKINNEPLENIVWFNKGKEIKLSNRQIKRWKFTGMSNYHFGKDLKEKYIDEK